MKMKKKYTYIRPQAEVMDIEPVSLCASSFDIDKQSEGYEDEDFSRGHRGTWGNLWAENM